MRITGLALLFIVIVTTTVYFSWYRPKFKPGKNHFSFAANKTNATNKNAVIASRLKQKAIGIKRFAASEDYDTTHCFFVDMGINSGKKRFFVYNLSGDSVEMAGLVTHGSGSDKGDELYFSNVSGSNCTSLGRYKIGKPYYGQFGLAYKLYGLDKTNNNAFERFVVLHAHACVPEEEVYPLSICRSWGCPTVSPAFLQNLRKYIDASEKPILLNIYH